MIEIILFVISIVAGLCKMKGLNVHPQLSRQHHPGIAAAAQNNAGDDDSDSDDDYEYVLIASDEE